MEQSYSLMVHGGAGALEHARDERIAARYLEGMRAALEHGRAILEQGGTAVDAVEACASLLEDDPKFNAGRGSVLNEHGKVEMDAGIMDGHTLAAGAVAAIGNIANPVQLARMIMERSEHVLLVGEGALNFAEHCGLKQTADEYFVTPERLEQLTQARLRGRMPLDHDEPAGPEKYGTIGVVARDCGGNLAAATSTGGLVNKRAGRIGDSPIIGAGVYADNATCAVSATGHGEDFMRSVFAKTIADVIEFRGLDSTAAVAYGIDHLRRKVNGRGGAICIDRTGRCASQTTTARMIRGWIEHSGETVCRF